MCGLTTDNGSYSLTANPVALQAHARAHHAGWHLPLPHHRTPLHLQGERLRVPRSGHHSRTHRPIIPPTLHKDYQGYERTFRVSECAFISLECTFQTLNWSKQPFTNIFASRRAMLCILVLCLATKNHDGMGIFRQKIKISIKKSGEKFGILAFFLYFCARIMHFSE